MPKTATGSAKVFKMKLSQLVKKVGWTQTEFGKRIGVSHPQARKYLEGESSPPFEMLDKISHALAIPVANLFVENNVIQPTPPHTLDDCLKAIATQVGSAMNFTPKQIDKAINTPASLADHDAFTTEILSLIDSFNNEQKKHALKTLKEIKHRNT